MALRTSYWSHSRIANWLLGTQRPRSATFEGWDAWHVEARSAHPLRYWLVETGISGLQDALCWPLDKLRDVRCYTRNRFIDKTHYCKTGLRPGGYYEFEDRVLHGMFNELVDFVECENAWMNVIFTDRVPRWRLRRFRSKEDGMARLDWECSLTCGSDFGVRPDDADFGKPTPQAVSAVETKALYLWWTEQRPVRRDPWEAVDENAEGYKERYGEMDRIEERYHAEDEEMLIRLVKLRRSLWT